MTLKFKGKLEKLTCAQVRDDVFKVNPKLAKIIDDLNSDAKHWLARVTYPYGCEARTSGEILNVMVSGNSEAEIIERISTVSSWLKNNIKWQKLNAEN